MYFEPLPSASGPVAPELFLEGGPSRDEAETATETESRDEEVHCFPHVHPLFDFLFALLMFILYTGDRYVVPRRGDDRYEGEEEDARRSGSAGARAFDPNTY